MGGLAPGELTAIQCKNIPDYLNDRTVLEKHFGQFVKVRRVMTRRNKKMAILHFFDHVSTAREQLEIKALGCPLYQTRFIRLHILHLEVNTEDLLHHGYHKTDTKRIFSVYKLYSHAAPA